MLMLIHKNKESLFFKLRSEVTPEVKIKDIIVSEESKVLVYDCYSSVVSGVCFEMKSLTNFEYYEAINIFQEIQKNVGNISFGYSSLLDFVSKHLVKIHEQKIDISNYSFDVLMCLVNAIIKESTISEDESSFL